MAITDPTKQYNTQSQALAPQATPTATPKPAPAPAAPAPAAPAPQGLVAGTMGAGANSAGMQAKPAASPAGAPKPAAPAAGVQTPRTVQPGETVQGQVDSILAKGGPLFDRARSLALEEFAGKGLVNSSMAIGAAQGAVMDKALEIAVPDAQIRSNAALQDDQQQFQSGEASLDRDSQLKLRQLEEAGVNNRFDRELAMRDKQFNAEQAAQDRRLAQQQANALEQMGYQNKLNNENVPSNFAASVSSSTMERVNSIMADPNLDAAAKKNAIQNVIDYANSTMAWAETFYKTKLPRLNSPGGSAIKEVDGKKGNQPVGGVQAPNTGGANSPRTEPGGGIIAGAVRNQLGSEVGGA